MHITATVLYYILIRPAYDMTRPTNQYPSKRPLPCVKCTAFAAAAASRGYVLRASLALRCS